jgi:DNA-binding sugar fermentation-stimulating protein
MKYAKIQQARFINRPNRFIARVEIEGMELKRVETVHVRNTGRCREILIPGTTVFLEEVNKPERKTRFSLISAYKDHRLINIDSQIPNAVVAEAIRNRILDRFQPLTLLKRKRFSVNPGLIFTMKPGPPKVLSKSRELPWNGMEWLCFRTRPPNGAPNIFVN